MVGFKGKIIFDKTKPDGNKRKPIDSKLINKLGWRSKISLEDGLSRAYRDYINTKPLNRYYLKIYIDFLFLFAKVLNLILFY